MTTQQHTAFAPLTIIQHLLNGYGVEGKSVWETRTLGTYTQYQLQTKLHFTTEKGSFELTWIDDEHTVMVRMQRADNKQFVEVPFCLPALTEKQTYAGLVTYMTGIKPTAPRRTYPFEGGRILEEPTEPIYAASSLVN